MNKKKKSIGVWIRVSTEDQKNGESPKVHLERAKLYAELHGYEIREVYDLSGISGKSVINTPQAQNMMYHIKQKHITGLIFSKIARFARNTRELLDFADYFKENDANLISLGESFDSNSPSGRLFFTFISAIGQWEREELVSRVNSSIQVRAKMGKRLGGKIPYGYTWDGHELHIEPKEASVRKLIFELFVQEKRKKTVASILNERGYKTRSGKKFYDSNVERWIRDPLSKGLRISNHTRKVVKNGKEATEYKPQDQWYYHKAPAIVSEELWQQANDILDEIQSKRKKPLNKRTHIFTQYIYCECGSNMSVRSGNKFYRCTRSGCGNKINREQFEIIFKEQLKSYVSSEENIEQYLSLSKSTAKDKELLFESQTIRRSKLKKKIDSIIQLHVDGQIPKETFSDYHDPIQEEIKLVENELQLLESEINLISKNSESISTVMKEATDLYNNWDNFNMTKKRRLVEMITERITISKDDSIHIKLFRLMPNSFFFESETIGQHNPFL
nr:recombinase family protein [uncultured Psychroserpens sp.]